MHELKKLEELIIPENRQRRKFNENALHDLATSITHRGLIHAPVVRNDGITLVAGERRLKAISLLHAQGTPFYYGGTIVPNGFVPVVPLSNLTPREYFEAELEENVIREDLTVVEKAQALAALHQLRTEQAEEKNEVQTLKATASEIKGSEAQGSEITAVREAILINSFADDPDVQKAKTQREAVNIAKKKIAAEFTAALAAKFDQTKISTPHTVLLGDCRDLAPVLPDSTYDVICVDPPYGIDADKMTPLSGSQSGVIHEYEDSFEYALSVWTTIFREGFRVCKPDAALYMFCDFRYVQLLTSEAQLHGWTVWGRPLIWHKPAGGMLGDIEHGPRKCYETILFAYKGDKRTTGTYSDVLSYNSEGSDIHAARKPVDLIVDLLKRSTVPGMKVIDFCAGSGTVNEAANRLRLIATTIERSEQHFGTLVSRLEK